MMLAVDADGGWLPNTPANTDEVLIATRGIGLDRKHAGIKSVVYSPLGAHSEKPSEVCHRLELLYGGVPRIGLFIPSAAPRWGHWENQCSKFKISLLPSSTINVIKMEEA